MNEIFLILPEICLLLTVCGLLLSELSYHGERARLVRWIALLGLAGAFLQTVLLYPQLPARAFEGALTLDGLSVLFKLLFLVCGGLAVVGVSQSSEIQSEKRAEAYALIIGAVIALSLLVCASNLLVLFVCLLFSLVMCHLLVAFSKRSHDSIEAAIKHLFIGSVSLILFLFALATLHRHFGTLSLHDLHWKLLSGNVEGASQLVIFFLVFFPIAFLLGSFPLQLWVPDVLQGAPAPISGFLVVAVRSAGLAVAIRLLFALFAQPSLTPGAWQVMGSVPWPTVLAFLAGVTLLFGSLFALRQQSVRRLLAGVVVHESGLFLLGLLVMSFEAMSALLFATLVQTLAWTGVYSVVGMLGDRLKTDRLASYRGAFWMAPPECAALILCLICAVGLPPLPGAVSQFALIGAALSNGWTGLAVVAILTRALSVIAVAKLALSLVGRSEDPAAQVQSWTQVDGSTVLEHRIFLVVILAPLVLVGVFAEVLLQWSSQSLQLILW